MNRLPSPWKYLACVLLAGTLAPAASDAAPQALPDSQPDYINPQSNPARPPVVVIVASDNVTVLHRVACDYRQNVASCLDAAAIKIAGDQVLLEEQAPEANIIVSGGYDDDGICALVVGRARIGSYLGANATANLHYYYSDLYIESDLKLRAAQ